MSVRRSALPIVVVAVLACAPRPPGGGSAVPPATGDVSRTALDWAGAYAGMLPCADCEGIATTLTLRADGTYALERRYVGGDGGLTLRAGRFTWRADGRAVTLEEERAAGAPHYLVGENQLIQLDREGERITGPLAERYVLRRVAEVPPMPIDPAVRPAAPGPLASVPAWALAVLRDATTPVPMEGGRPPYVAFGTGGEVTGQAGCNAFTGRYEAAPSGALRISPLAATRRACPALALEQALFRALAQAERFEADTATLRLYGAEPTPLAVFRALGARPD